MGTWSMLFPRALILLAASASICTINESYAEVAINSTNMAAEFHCGTTCRSTKEAGMNIAAAQVEVVTKSGNGSNEYVVHASPSNYGIENRGLIEKNRVGRQLNLVGAINESRRIRANIRAGRIPPGKLIIRLAPGLYRLDETIELGERDSGELDSPLIFQSEVPHQARITGATQLGVKSQGQERIVFDASPVNRDWADGGQLFIDGRRMTLARTPNRGEYWYVNLRSHPNPSVSEKQRGPISNFFPSDDVASWLSSLPKKSETRAILNMYQAWTTGKHRIQGVSRTRGIDVRPPPMWEFMQYGDSQRYFIENIPEALDQAEEWIGEGDEVHLLRDSKAGNSGNIKAELPVLEVLLRISGDKGSSAKAKNIWIDGLVFEKTYLKLHHTNGIVDMQAALMTKSAIEVANAENIKFQNCRFEALGGYGIDLQSGSNYIQVIGNEFVETGAGAVKIGSSRKTESNMFVHSAVVSGNLISGTGKELPAAVAIWVGNARSISIKRNVIRRTTYTGISIGWSWGYAESQTEQVMVEENILEDIGDGGLSDLGAIYTLGSINGSIIRGNLIKNVKSYSWYGPRVGKGGGWGIYFDEGTSGVEAVENAVVDTDSGAVRLNYGNNIQVARNILFSGEGDEITIGEAKPKDYIFDVRQNYAISSSSVPSSPWRSIRPEYINKNTTVESVAKSISYSTQECKRNNCIQVMSEFAVWFGVDRRILLFPNESARDEFERLMGYFNQLIIGSISGKDRSTEKLERAGPAPPTSFRFRASDFDIGDWPEYFSLYPKEGHSDVAINTFSSTSEKCLKVVDGPQYRNPWEPFFSTQLNRKPVNSSVAFEFALSRDASMLVEWRDSRLNQKTGPSLKVKDLKVTGGGKEIVGIDANRIYRIVMAINSKGWAGSIRKWNMSLYTRDGLQLAQQEVPMEAEAWHEFKWLGFIFDTTAKGEACIYGISVGESE